MQLLAPLAAATAATLVLAVSSATAQGLYRQDFETLNASAAGTPLTGQDGFYIPPNTTSVDVLTHTFAGNPYGIPAGANGGNHFIAGNGPAGGTYCRAQRSFAWAATDYTIGFDVAVHFAGTLPTGNNCGSISLQPSGSAAYFIALARWTDFNTATTWDADFVHFDAAGTSVTGTVGDPAFLGLALDHWYRWEIDFDLVSNTILEIRLYDLTTGTVATNAPSGWYLTGGSAGGFPLPTDFRFFIGGSVAGNVMTFDNLSIGPRAEFATYGAGCAGTNGTPTIDAAAGALPRVGTTFDLDLTNLPTAGSAVFGLIGLSDTNWGGLTLPFDLSPLGMTGCFALTDIMFVTQQTVPGPSGTWALPVPNDTSLLNGTIFLQALVADAGANGFGMTTTNGGSCRIGG